jgi:hypothetical protein
MLPWKGTLVGLEYLMRMLGVVVGNTGESVEIVIERSPARYSFDSGNNLDTNQILDGVNQVIQYSVYINSVQDMPIDSGDFLAVKNFIYALINWQSPACSVLTAVYYNGSFI